jgi:hypothetical protein
VTANLPSPPCTVLEVHAGVITHRLGKFSPLVCRDHASAMPPAFGIAARGMKSQPASAGTMKPWMSRRARIGGAQQPSSATSPAPARTSVGAEGTADHARKITTSVSPFYANTFYPNTFRVLTYGRQ